MSPVTLILPYFDRYFCAAQSKLSFFATVTTHEFAAIAAPDRPAYAQSELFDDGLQSL